MELLLVKLLQAFWLNKMFLGKRGFTLIEVMVTVSIIVVLSSIGIPIYKGYLKDAKIGLAKNNLNNIYLAETNYYFVNNEYFYSGSTCGDHNTNIISNLFNNQKIIETDKFKGIEIIEPWITSSLAVTPIALETADCPTIKLLVPEKTNSAESKVKLEPP